MERRPVVELQDDSWVVIRRCRLRREAERYALVLAAMGISSRIHFDGERVLLLVANENAGAADREILTYVRENSHPAPQPLKIQQIGRASCRERVKNPVSSVSRK